MGRLGKAALLLLVERSAVAALAMKGFGDLFQRGLSGPAPAAPAYALNAEQLQAVPSAALLREGLARLATAEESQAWAAQLRGRGPASHAADLRLFDAPDDHEPAVTLYRDRAAWCPYCEKVWLQLEEKRIPYRVLKSPLRCYGEKTKEHLRVSPSGMLPVAVINGKVIAESNVIMQELEDAFPQHRALLPPRGSAEELRVPGLLRLERRVFGSWFTWLTSRAGESAAKEMDQLLRALDAELEAGGGPYFLGADFSLVDCMYTPFLERMAASLPYFKGFQVAYRNGARGALLTCAQVRCDAYPNLRRWFEAMDGREAYRALKSDYYTHCWALPPQIGQCHSLPSALPFREEIDGGAWRLDFRGIEPMVPSDAGQAGREAARSLLGNLEAVTRFAARGAGERGVPGVAAELADPNARPSEALLPAVDAALRMVADGLLGGSSLTEASVRAMGFPEQLRPCLLYLRERVGVPRDMSVHAARLMRAHLNLLLDAL